jgi:hypothetical protein
MKRRFYSNFMFAISILVATLMFTACEKDNTNDSDDGSGNGSGTESGMVVSISDIEYNKATVSWNLVSDNAYYHDVVVTDKATSEEVFTGSTSVDIETEDVTTSILVDGLEGETQYTVIVTAYDEEINLIEEASADFTTASKPALPAVEDISIVEGEISGWRISWTAVDEAHGYFIYFNGVSLTDDIPITGIPYTTNEEPAQYDTIRVDAYNQLTDEIIASGYIIYKEDEPSTVTNVVDEAGDGTISLSWTEPLGDYDYIAVFVTEGIGIPAGTDSIVVQKGTTTLTITDLENCINYNVYFKTVNSKSGKTALKLGASDVLPYPANSIRLSNTFWRSDDGKTLDFDYARDPLASNVAEYTDGDFSKRISYYFSPNTNVGKMKNFDWNGWETSTEYFELTYNPDTEKLTYNGIDYLLVEE